MSNSVNDVSLITDLNVNEYFNDAIHDAITHQSISAREDTIVYIVNLLTHYTLTENINQINAAGLSSKPLALMYKDAVEAESKEERNTHLRKLGDIALFTSGLFSASFEKSAVGIDYFISMGGCAYGSLADSNTRGFSDKGMREVFSDLAEHFLNYVDVLIEVSESNELNDDRDVLCLYESWLTTGSEYARKRLKENGILTFTSSHKKH